MNVPAAVRPIFYLLLATTLWGVASVLLAQLGGAYGSSAPVIASGACIGLTLWSLVTKQIRTHKFFHHSLFLRLGILEAANIAMYAAALQIGSTFVVVALHLTSPIILILFSFTSRQERHKPILWLQLVLISFAILLFGSQSPPGETLYKPLAAVLLALGSAVAVAALINLVANNAATLNPDCSAALQLGIAAALTSPLLIAGIPDQLHRVPILMLAGALLLGPGFALYWRALRNMSGSAAAVLGLNEAVVATVMSTVVFGELLSLQTILSGLLILSSVFLQSFSK